MVIFGNLGILQRSCVLCLGHLKVKQSSYTISDLPTSPSHVWGRFAGFRSMPKDFCWFENVIGRCLTVFLFIYKDLGGSASSSRGQHHPECLFGLTQVRLLNTAIKIVIFKLTFPGSCLFWLCKLDDNVESCIVDEIESFKVFCSAVQCSVMVMMMMRTLTWCAVQCTAV